MRNPTSPNGSTSIQNGLLCGGGATMAARRKSDQPLNLTPDKYAGLDVAWISVILTRTF
jgi:hypothetical protein